MNVPNHEKKAFKDMTPEERSAIVEAVISGNGEAWNDRSWVSSGRGAVFYSTIYRTRPRQLVIPWEHIKPEYKWAAMNEAGSVFLHEHKPVLQGVEWCSYSACNTRSLNINTTDIDWRESLTQRPE